MATHSRNKTLVPTVLQAHSGQIDRGLNTSMMRGPRRWGLKARGGWRRLGDGDRRQRNYGARWQHDGGRDVERGTRHISDNIQIPQHGGLQASNKRVETFVKRKGALLS